MTLTLECVEKAESKAEKLDAIRCLMQQCAIEMHELGKTLGQDDWSEYEDLAGMEEFGGLAEDVGKLLEDGTL